MSEVVGLHQKPQAAAPDLPPSRLDPAKKRDGPLRFRSIVVRGDLSGRDLDSGFTPMPKVWTSRLMRDHWREQKETREKRRQSKGPTQQHLGAQDYLEPPFNPDVLTELLFESSDFFPIVDQLALDVAGLGWDLIDAETVTGPPAAPEQGEMEVEADADAIAVEQRALAEDYLDNLAGDFTGTRISLADLFKQTVMDWGSIGSGYVEVSREEGSFRPNGLFHVIGRLIRRLPGQRGYVQLDDQDGRPAALFRQWGSDPNAESSRITDQEARDYGLTPGELKNELKVFQHYHSGEAYYGVPPVISGLVAVYGNIYAEARNLRFFTNRAVPDWLVTIKAEAHVLEDENNRTVIDAYIANLEEHLRHLVMGDDHRTAIVELPTDIMEVTWEKLIPDATDADFPTYRKDNRDTTLRQYRMLPQRVGIMETASLGSGTGESQEETYKRAQVDPRQSPIERFMDEILEQGGFTLLSFKFREIDVLDEQRESGIFATTSATGCLTINDMRRWASRFVKDQDFPDYEDDLADIPTRILDFMVASMGVMPTGLPSVSPFAPETPSLPITPLEQQGADLRQGLSVGLGLPTSRQWSTDPGFRNYFRRMQNNQRGRFHELRTRLMEARRNGDQTPAPAAPGATAAPGADEEGGAVPPAPGAE